MSNEVGLQAHSWLGRWTSISHLEYEDAVSDLSQGA